MSSHGNEERMLSLIKSMTKAKKIRLLALDVDGVLTDGTLYIGPQGETFKVFSAQDGLGITTALKGGLIIALITGRNSEIVAERARELGISEVQQGIREKGEALCALAAKYNLTADETAYMGDDLNDLEALSAAGLSCAPADAVKDVRERVDYVAAASGGHGAVREVVETILKARGEWQPLISAYAENRLGDGQ